MTEPAAQSPWRVPRSREDELFLPTTPSPDIEKMSGEVVSVEIDSCTVLVLDEEIGGVIFYGDPPEVGAVVEIERRGDLWVLSEDWDSYIEGGASDAWHIVSDEEPELPPPTEVQVSGSMRDANDWTASGAWEASWLESSALMTQVAVGEGLLSSNEVFDVEPGDDVNIDLDFTVTAGTPVVTVRVYLATIEDSAVGPSDPDTAVFSSDPLPYTVGETSRGSWSMTVPDTIATTNNNNEGIPAFARVEVSMTQEDFATWLTVGVEHPTWADLIAGNPTWADVGG